MVDKNWKLIENILYFGVHKIFRLKYDENGYMSLVQFVKFGVVGLLNNIICYATYLLLMQVGMHYTLANIIGFTVSVFNAYYWNNKYVFVSEGTRVWWKTFLKTYVSYAGTGILLSNIFLMMWIELCKLSAVIVPLINLIVTVPINFLVNKFWAYKK